MKNAYATPVVRGSTEDVSATYTKFSDEVKQRGADGEAHNSALGWGLYIFFIIDALLNARGQGGVTTAFVNWALMHGIIGSENFFASFLIILVQLPAFTVSAICLRRSPWRRYLRTSLQKAWPGRWLSEILPLRGTASASPSLEFSSALLRTIALETILLCISFFLVAPLLSGLDPVLRFPLLAATAYGLTMLIVTVSAHIPRDTGTLIGVGVGGVAAPILAWMLFRDAMLPPPWLVIAGSSFSTTQSFIFILAIFLVWSLSVNSITGADLIRLELGDGPGPIIFEFPDATAGAFSPVHFEVVPNSRKIALISRAPQGSTAYTLHTTKDQYPLNERRWTLLDLSELERRIGQSGSPNGRLTVVRKGVSKFMTCETHIDVRTVTPEAIFSQQLNEIVRCGRAQMEFGEFAHFHDTIFAGAAGSNSTGLIADAIAEDLGKIVDAELDVTWAPALARSAKVSSINQVFDSIQVAIKHFEYECGRELAQFSVLCSDVTSIYRRESIDQAIQQASRNMDQARRRLENTYNLVRQFDAIESDMGSRLTSKVKGLEKIFKARGVSQRHGNQSGVIFINIFDFIKIAPGEVKVGLTSEAITQLDSVKDAYEKFDQTFFFNQLREMVANNGAATNAYINNLVALGYQGLRAANQVMASGAPQGTIATDSSSTAVSTGTSGRASKVKRIGSLVTPVADASNSSLAQERSISSNKRNPFQD